MAGRPVGGEGTSCDRTPQLCKFCLRPGSDEGSNIDSPDPQHLSDCTCPQNSPLRRCCPHEIHSLEISSFHTRMESRPTCTTCTRASFCVKILTAGRKCAFQVSELRSHLRLVQRESETWQEVSLLQALQKSCPLEILGL